MPADPVLARLVEDAARATAALQAYITGAPADAASDLVPLRDAQAEFSRSEDTVRRWARDEGLGEIVNGKWHLRRSAVLRHKFAQSMPTHDAEVTAPTDPLF